MWPGRCLRFCLTRDSLLPIMLFFAEKGSTAFTPSGAFAVNINSIITVIGIFNRMKNHDGHWVHRYAVG